MRKRNFLFLSKIAFATAACLSIPTIGFAVQKNDLSVTQQQGTYDLTGKVIDQTGEPIIGANILVKGTTNGTVTDFDGNFTIQVTNKSVLEISYIGYLSQDIQVAGKRTLSITLKEDTQALSEVVVVGYGTQAKVNLTGSVASVGEKELNARPITSVSAGIQGLAPGVSALTASGKPGADGASFQIRGKGTLNNSDPYILVDGIETGTID